MLYKVTHLSIAVALLLFSLTSCQKESFSHESLDEETIQDTKPLNLGESSLVKLTPSERKNFINKLLREKEKTYSPQLLEALDTILLKYGSAIYNTDYSVNVVSYYIHHISPDTFLNLVLGVTDSTVYGAVYQYEMDSVFANQYYNFTTSFDQFEGTIAIYPLSILEYGYKKDPTLEECQRLRFGTSGGSSPGTITGGGLNSPSSPGSSGSSGGSGGWCAEITVEPCSCSPSHTNSAECTCREGKPSVVVEFYACNNPENLSSSPPDNKDLLEECKKIYGDFFMLLHNPSRSDDEDSTPLINLYSEMESQLGLSSSELECLNQNMAVKREVHRLLMSDKVFENPCSETSHYPFPIPRLQAVIGQECNSFNSSGFQDISELHSLLLANEMSGRLPATPGSFDDKLNDIIQSYSQYNASIPTPDQWMFLLNNPHLVPIIHDVLQNNPSSAEDLGDYLEYSARNLECVIENPSTGEQSEMATEEVHIDDFDAPYYVIGEPTNSINNFMSNFYIWQVEASKSKYRNGFYGKDIYHMEQKHDAMFRIFDHDFRGEQIINVVGSYQAAFKKYLNLGLPLDVAHFFKCAALARKYPNFIVRQAYVNEEFKQAEDTRPAGRTSSFSPEDLFSNELGVIFASSLGVNDDMGEELEIFLNEAHTLFTTGFLTEGKYLTNSVIDYLRTEIAQKYYGTQDLTFFQKESSIYTLDNIKDINANALARDYPFYKE